MWGKFTSHFALIKRLGVKLAGDKCLCTGKCQPDHCHRMGSLQTRGLELSRPSRLIAHRWRWILDIWGELDWKLMGCLSSSQCSVLPENTPTDTWHGNETGHYLRVWSTRVTNGLKNPQDKRERAVTLYLGQVDTLFSDASEAVSHTQRAFPFGWNDTLSNWQSRK